MYRPIKDGIDKNARLVSYIEEIPPKKLADYVHCFWELKTLKALEEDFLYHVLPDACVNILLDQKNIDVAAVTALQSEHKKLNLGKEFHYIGVQFLPGVWRGNPSEIQDDLVNSTYMGELDLREVNLSLSSCDFTSKQEILAQYVLGLADKGFVQENKMISKLLKNLDNIRSVSDMSDLLDVSSRQLQRKIKKDIGVSPHDFLKILRIHLSFEEHYLDYYSDQSHFIHSFKKITGYTPKKYSKKFDV